MELIKQADLDLIAQCAGKEVNDDDFNKLKLVYAKLKNICEVLKDKGFQYNIRLDPSKQAGPGGFVFQDYQWAKVYPKEYYSAASDKLAYIIGLSETVHFHLMGIKEFQQMPASKNASKECWTEIDFENVSYEEITNQFIEFDKKFRKLFIKTAAELGIKEFIQISNSMEQNEILELLRYKKQIILQGPPGTGKTRLARKLAVALTGISELPTSLFEITDNDIIVSLDSVKKIPTVAGNVVYDLLDVNPVSKSISLRKSTGTEAPISSIGRKISIITTIEGQRR